MEQGGDAIDINVTEEEANELLASDNEADENSPANPGTIRIITDKLLSKPGSEVVREVEAISRPAISDADHEDYPVVPNEDIHPTSIPNDMCFTFQTNHMPPKSCAESNPQNYESDTESLIAKLDKLGVFSGSEQPLPQSSELRNVGQKKVPGSINVTSGGDDDSSDDEIEMIGVVTSDKVKYKVIKIEEQADVKTSM